jgi:hypothetical protein
MSLFDVLERPRPPPATAARQKNRDAFPFTATIIDDMRAHFGNGVRVSYAKENGKTVGAPLQPHEEGVPFSEPDQSSKERCACRACTRKPKKRRALDGSFGIDEHKKWKQLPLFRWRDE